MLLGKEYLAIAAISLVMLQCGAILAIYTLLVQLLVA